MPFPSCLSENTPEVPPDAGRFVSRCTNRVEEASGVLSWRLVRHSDFIIPFGMGDFVIRHFTIGALTSQST